MQLKLHPRFFVLVGIIIFGITLFSSNFFLKKRVEVNLVGKSPDSVLAAEDSTLFGNLGGTADEKINDTKDAANTASNIKKDIAEYVPVTISHTVKEGDTLQSIAEKYNADAQTIADFPNNKLGESLQLSVGQILIVPNGYIDGSSIPPPPVAQGTGQLAWPAKGIITQYAYYWHPGAIDIALPMLTPIRAADDGKVIKVERFTTGYGVHVILDHGNGLISLYAHLTDAQVTQGQSVRKGEVVGMSGSTGRSTGPHLHFEIRQGQNVVDPMTLLPAE